ncbi:MAG: hypothetical protein JWR16_3093 [Nevskia sp.]|nr:hypothetical protein [Nevskia sp.]
MKNSVSMFVAVLLLSAAVPVCAQDSGSYPPPPGSRNDGPPQPPADAFSACVGKSEGDVVTINTPLGNTLAGTCRKFGDRLAARPNQPPPGGRRPPDQ